MDDISVIFTVALDEGQHRPRNSLCLAVLGVWGGGGCGGAGGRSLALHPDEKADNLMHEPFARHEEGPEFREEAQEVIPICHARECPQGAVLKSRLLIELPQELPGRDAGRRVCAPGGGGATRTECQRKPPSPLDCG